MGKFSAMTDTFRHVFDDVKSPFRESLFDAWPGLTATEVPACRIDDKMRLDHTVC